MLRKIISNRKIVYIFTVLMSALLIFVGNKVACTGLQLFSDNSSPAYKATVIKVLDTKSDDYTLGENDYVQSTTTITFIARLESGEHKGETIKCIQSLDSLYAIQPSEVKKGQQVLVFENTDTESYDADYIMSERVRTNYLTWLLVIFFFCLILFGGFKGFNTIVSLCFTVLSVCVVFLPAVLSGKNVYLWSTGVCLYIIVMTLLVVYGIKRQSIAAAISCFSGMLVAGGMTLVMSKVMALTGLVDEQSYYLTMLSTENPINLNAITYAAITIGAVGAIMDVSISISASLQEVNKKAPNLSRIALMGSGMTIGRDMMGTMANTLVLAYIGSSLSLTLLLIAYQSSVMELLNKELIITELLQILVGSFGILLTIPLSSFVCSVLYKRKTKESIQQ